MERDGFPPGVAERLGYYVYRLIDPRNGETFYVGKGKGDRVFHHVKSASEYIDDEDEVDLKFQRIKDIQTAGLEVAHVIHQHKIENEAIAFQIEAALIDAYPGATNKVVGHGSSDYGCRHVEEIIFEYEAKPFEAGEPLILISIAQTYYDTKLDIYDAVRGVWRISKHRAQNYKLVLAQRHGIVLGAYRPTEWLPATAANFPKMLSEDYPGRFGFVGTEAEEAVAKQYIRRRVPDAYRKRGAANPIRFVPKSATATAEDVTP